MNAELLPGFVERMESLANGAALQYVRGGAGEPCGCGLRCRWCKTSRISKIEIAGSTRTNRNINARNNPIVPINVA